MTCLSSHIWSAENYHQNPARRPRNKANSLHPRRHRQKPGGVSNAGQPPPTLGATARSRATRNASPTTAPGHRHQPPSLRESRTLRERTSPPEPPAPPAHAQNPEPRAARRGQRARRGEAGVGGGTSSGDTEDGSHHRLPSRAAGQVPAPGSLPPSRRACPGVPAEGPARRAPRRLPAGRPLAPRPPEAGKVSGARGRPNSPGPS